MLKERIAIAWPLSGDAKRVFEQMEAEQAVHDALSVPIVGEIHDMDRRRQDSVTELARDISRVRVAALQTQLMYLAPPPAEEAGRTEASDRDTYPRPGSDAAAVRAGEAITSKGPATEIIAQDAIPDDDLEPGELLRCRGVIGEIAEELADVAKQGGMFATLNISVTLDGRPPLADETESG